MAPENLDARAKLAFVFLDAGQFEDARNEALAILDQAPSHEDAMRLLAASSLKKEDLGDAEQRLRSLNANDKPGFYIALASISFESETLTSAQSDLERAISLDPASVELISHWRRYTCRRTTSPERIVNSRRRRNSRPRGLRRAWPTLNSRSAPAKWTKLRSS